MSARGEHYEAALADFFLAYGIPFVAVNEVHRAALGDEKIKSFDFIVYPADGPAWLVDVKGRRFPYTRSSGAAARRWENWVTQADLDGLETWEAVFGDGFEAVLTFSYWLGGDPAKWPTLHTHAFGGRHYTFFALPLAVYRRHARPRSRRWNTVALPTRLFRQVALPLSQRLGCA